MRQRDAELLLLEQPLRAKMAGRTGGSAEEEIYLWVQ